MDRQHSPLQVHLFCSVDKVGTTSAESPLSFPWIQLESKPSEFMARVYCRCLTPTKYPRIPIVIRNVKGCSTRSCKRRRSS